MNVKNKHKLIFALAFSVVSWAGWAEVCYSESPSGMPAGLASSPASVKSSALRLFEQKNYNEAIVQCQKYLENEPGDEAMQNLVLKVFVRSNRVADAIAFIDKISGSDGAARTRYRNVLANYLLRDGKISEAETFYSGILQENPDNTLARAGMVVVLIHKKNYDKAEEAIRDALAANPKDMDLLFAQVELCEARKDYVEAIERYEHILELYPGKQAAINLRYRVFMTQGSQGLASDKMDVSGEGVDAELREELMGNKAAQRVLWNESAQAMRILEKNRHYAIEKKDDDAFISRSASFGLRRQGDLILALRLKEHMKTLKKEYELFPKPAPDWVTNAGADAYLYLEEPEKALALYRRLLSKGWDPANGNVTMGLYYTLVELGKYSEAEKVLEGFDLKTPAQLVDRGVLIDNPRKQEIALNRAWLLLYQDRLSKAQPMVDDLMSRSPFDSATRNLAAHTELWRGWPRLALEEFEIIRHIDSEDIGAMVGHQYALNENDHGDEARDLAKKLLRKQSAHKAVRRQNRAFAVQDMQTARTGVTFTHDNAGFEAFQWTARYEKPIKPWRSIFAEIIVRNSKSSALKKSDRRLSAGLDWRLNRDWAFIGSVSGDTDQDKVGFAGRFNFSPTDHLTFGAGYDSFSLDLPLRARTLDVTAEEWDISARYRESEAFFVNASAAFMAMSDGNEHQTYTITADHALTTQAYWKTRVAVEGNLTTNSKNDAEYFNPESLYSIYVTPMVEHVWFRRYDRSWTERYFLGQGIQWQSDFSSEPIWHARYEHDVNFSDTCSMLAGLAYLARNYDGQGVDEWSFDAALKVKF